MEPEKNKDNLNKFVDSVVTFINRVTALFKVKSLLTIILAILFYNLAIVGVVESKDVVTIFLMVVSFYFGTQSNKE